MVIFKVFVLQKDYIPKNEKQVMEPITSIINKIKWDEKENPEDYTIGYEDRISKKIVEVQFAEIKRVEDNFMVLEKDLEEVSIPLHRIRIVKKKGKIVWKRQSPEQKTKARGEP